MAKTRILALVLAGGKGGRLELLTAQRAKPAVPYAGTHRLIDFPLSNCLNAGITDVWVSQQYEPVSLDDHLANGRPWDLDRTTGGLLMLTPRQGDERSGWQAGTADGLWRNSPLIRQFAPEALVVVSADAVYKLDYDDLVTEHLDSDADVTMVTTEVAREDASRYGVVQVNASGKVTDYVYKPDEAASSIISNEVFVFTPDPLLDALDELGEQAGEEGLEDLGTALLPRLVGAGAAREHRFEGYWRDVGTIAAYYSSNLELLADPQPIDLDDKDWPILTRAASRRAPARIAGGARVEESLLASASLVEGTVERSVIGRGARVEAGAVVRDSVVLPDAVVRAGACVETAILDDAVEVSAGARVGAAGGEIALVGLQAVVAEGAELPAGARYPEQ